MTVAGYGFAAPLLRPFLAEARRVMALMPGPQGVMPWPPAMPNVALLVRGDALADRRPGFLDRLVVRTGSRPASSPRRCSRSAGACSAPAGGRCSSCRTGPGSGPRRTPRRSATAGPTASASSRRCCAATGFQPERRDRRRSTSRPRRGRSGARRRHARRRPGGTCRCRAAGGVLIVEATKQAPAPDRRRPGRGGAPARSGRWRACRSRPAPRRTRRARPCRRGRAAGGAARAPGKRRVASVRGTPLLHAPQISAPAEVSGTLTGASPQADPGRATAPGQRRKGGRVRASIDLPGHRRPLRQRRLRPRQEDGSLARIERDLDAIEAALAESADFRALIASPIYSRAEQGRAIARGRRPHGPVADDGQRARPDGRASAGSSCCRSCCARSARASPDERGEVTAEVTSATPLTRRAAGPPRGDAVGARGTARAARRPRRPVADRRPRRAGRLADDRHLDPLAARPAPEMMKEVG